MENAIGGYFELELPRHEEYHQNALRLNSGKNCLEYILRVRNYSKVYIPYYTCDVILRPFQKLGIEYQFYHINLQFEIADDVFVHKGEALLYTNYYGLKQRYVEILAEKYGSSLILDNTQAFYARPIKGIDTFYTCRKFFGVSDGAYLYTDAEPLERIKQSTSYGHVAHLVKRIDLSAQAGFEDFHQSDEMLANEDIMFMSNFTERMMQSIDYEGIAAKRRANYQKLHEALGAENNLELPLDEGTVPMVYPYLVPIKGLREKLIDNKIFVARYWPNVLNWTTKDDIEYLLAFQMQPLPIDQRYGIEEMKRIIGNIKK